jgi:Ca2+-binding EF-hand superfamily protein
VGYKGDIRLRENRLLSEVFKVVNTTVDGILSLGEILDMTSRLEIFLTEEEGSRVFLLMDIDGDEKVTEADFIGFMKKSSDIIPRKAARIRETAFMVRRWLLSGTAGLLAQAPVDPNNSISGMFNMNTPQTIEGATEMQWQSLKRKHERASGQKFPGYLNAGNLVKLVGSLGMCISVGEARELTLLIGPEKRGRIQKEDLSAFISRTSRSFGELLTLLERDLLREIIGAYRKLRDAVRDDGTTAGAKSESNPVLLQRYEALVSELLRMVQGSYVSSKQEGTGTEPTQDDKKIDPTALDLVSIFQLKTGIVSTYRESKSNNNSNIVSIAEGQIPNLEEWALLALLAGAGVCSEDTYGVRVRQFVDGICLYAVGGIGTGSVVEGKVSLEVICRDLQRMIR